MGEQGLSVPHVPRSRRREDTGDEAEVMGSGGGSRQRLVLGVR
jgi:hypothetical protein